MSDKPKPSWMTPVQYNDERWQEPVEAEGMALDAIRGDDGDDEADVRSERDVQEIMRREERAEREYECNDTTPVRYDRGPHDEEFGVDDKEFDQADASPVPYEQGPHEEEFGIEDDFQPLDDGSEFPEY